MQVLSPIRCSCGRDIVLYAAHVYFISILTEKSLIAIIRKILKTVLMIVLP